MRRPRRRLVHENLRVAVMVVAGLAASGFLLMGVRYRGQTEAGWVDGVVADSLTGWGSRGDWVLERLIDLGDPLPAAGLVVLTGIAGLAVCRWRGLLLAAAAPALAVLAAELMLKPLVGRTDEDGLVFPSTHATVIGAVAATAAILILAASPPRLLRARRLPVLLGFGIVTTGKAVALAAAGYHYFTDGVGGALLAIAVVLTAALLVDAGAERVDRRRG